VNKPLAAGDLLKLFLFPPFLFLQFPSLMCSRLGRWPGCSGRLLSGG